MTRAKRAKRIGIVAGEASGDILGAGLIRELEKLFPGSEYVGVGGPRMIAAGCGSLVPMERLAVMGFVEPLGRLPELLRIKRLLERTFIDNPPDVFIGIDSPDFNLRVERKLRAVGIPVAHYVSPSVWAYREKRIHGIKESVDLMLTLFPFETEIYELNAIPVRCVGHPLADSIDFEDRRLESRSRFDLSASDPVLTLMPGSRSGEIKRLAPAFIGAALEAQQYCAGLRFLIPCAGPEARLQLKQLMSSAGVFSSSHFQLVDDSRSAISAADLVLTASGTATLECLLLRRPMLVCYRLAPLTYFLASRMVRIAHIALPNLLAGRELVPEFIQDRVTVSSLRQAVVEFFNDQPDQQQLLREFESIHRGLHRDASRQAAMAIAELLGSGTGKAACNPNSAHD